MGHQVDLQESRRASFQSAKVLIAGATVDRVGIAVALTTSNNSALAVDSTSGARKTVIGRYR